jgi:hypothetical protein
MVSVPVEKHRIHDIHHLTEEYLSSYIVIDSSLPKGKLHEVNAESKS